MNKSKTVRAIAGCLVIILIVILIISSLSGLFMRKLSYTKNGEILSGKTDYDVLFLGTSHMIDAVYPMELWNDYGITSYNLGGHGCELATSYWIMENALEHISPKLVVVDCYYLSSESKIGESADMLHDYLDIYPVSNTKINAVRDLTDSTNIKDNMDLLWNFSAFHSRFNDLSRVDFKPEYSVEKGAQFQVLVGSTTAFNPIPDDMMSDENAVGAQYLNKIISSCNSRGMDVLLTYLPFPAAGEYQMEANLATKLANDNNLNYINFLKEDIVDYNTDIANDYTINSHLNPSGARKLTKYLGQYLIDNYSLTDHRTDAAYECWNDDYKAYEDLKRGYEYSSKSIKDHLMMLYDTDLTTIIDIYDKSIYDNPTFMSLITNLGIDASEISSDTDFIIAGKYGADNTPVAIALNSARVNDYKLQTDIGLITVTIDETGESHNGMCGMYDLYIDDVLMSVGDNDQTIGAALRTFDPATHEAVDQVKYDYSPYSIDTVNIQRPFIDINSYR